MKFNYKDENEWSDDQERNIAMRKARSNIFFLRLLWLVFFAMVGGVVYEENQYRSEPEMYILGGLICLGLIVLLFLRSRYLMFKYRT